MKKVTMKKNRHGRVNTTLFTNSTMPNVAKKRVRHKTSNIKEHSYEININPFTLINCAFLISIINTEKNLFALVLLLINALLTINIKEKE